MKLLGIDFETTFTDPVNPRACRIIEVGAVLWDSERNIPLRMFNQVCNWLPEYGEFDPRVEELTGLSAADLAEYGKHPSQVLGNLNGLIAQSDLLVAHNGREFDEIVLAEELRRHSLAIPVNAVGMKWIDTLQDIPYPKKIKTRSLEFLGPAHGFLNPFSHRALFDVLSMMTVLSKYPLAEVIARANSKRVVLRAWTAKPWEDGGVSNNAAKELGYRFDGDKKQWLKKVLENEVESEIALALGKLKVTLLEGV